MQRGSCKRGDRVDAVHVSEFVASRVRTRAGDGRRSIKLIRSPVEENTQNISKLVGLICDPNERCKPAGLWLLDSGCPEAGCGKWSEVARDNY